MLKSRLVIDWTLASAKTGCTKGMCLAAQPNIRAYVEVP